MPATRSRTSTEQAAEVATEEVKQQPTETEPVVAKVDEEEEEVKEAEPAVAEDAPPAPVEEAKPEPEESVPTNGDAKEIIDEEDSQENGSAESAEADAEVDEPAVEKRKSEVVGGEGDGPDSTEVVAKKAKVDEESTEAPVEASA